MFEIAGGIILAWLIIVFWAPILVLLSALLKYGLILGIWVFLTGFVGYGFAQMVGTSNEIGWLFAGIATFLVMAHVMERFE